MARPFRPTRRHKQVTAAIAVGAGLLVATIPVAAYGNGDKNGAGIVDVQMLSFNDLHGNLDPPAGSTTGTVNEQEADGSTKSIPAGGVSYLATHLRDARKGHPYSVTVSAGDNVGGGSLATGMFHDEPTIDALNQTGLDVSALGEHEFDHGLSSLDRLQHGGCDGKDSCLMGRFKGADFSYLGANAINKQTGKTVMPPYTIWRKNGVKIGFIGVTLKDAPNLVPDEGVKDVEFQDEVSTINKYATILHDKGVNAIVALVHQGALPWGATYNYDCGAFSGLDGITGPVDGIAHQVSPLVDALVTGHTHQAYACNVPDPDGNPREVVSAEDFGKLYTDVTLPYDRSTGDIVRAQVTATNHAVSRDVPAAPDVAALLDRWNQLAFDGRRKIGYISADIDNNNALPESPLGDVVADSQLALARNEDPSAAVALVNPGRIRADLGYPASGDEGDGVVTHAEAYAVLPFGNQVDLVDFTGAQLLQVLDEQLSGDNEALPRILQVSSGFTYTLDMTKSGAARVVADSVKINGKPLDTSAHYKVAINSYLAEGKDGFPTAAKGQDSEATGADITALETYIRAHSAPEQPLKPPAAKRITVIEPQQ